MAKRKRSPEKPLAEKARKQKEGRLSLIRQRAEIAVAYFRRDITGADAAMAMGVSHSRVASILSSCLGPAVANGIVRIEFTGVSK